MTTVRRVTGRWKRAIDNRLQGRAGCAAPQPIGPQGGRRRVAAGGAQPLWLLVSFLPYPVGFAIMLPSQENGQGMRTENAEPFPKAVEQGQEKNDVAYLSANLPKLEKLIAELQERSFQLADLAYRARSIRDRLVGNRKG